MTRSFSLLCGWVQGKGRSTFGGRTVAAVLAVIAAAFFSGCDRNAETEVDRLVIISGDGAMGQVGALKTIKVEVLGPSRRGLLGGKGDARPVPGIKVQFEPADLSSGLVVVGPREVRTDPGGLATTEVRLGNRFGDQYLRVVLPDHGPKESVRLTAGVTVTGNKQETFAGDTLPMPFALTVTDDNGAPVPGVPVYFRLTRSAGKKAKIQVMQGVTDADGTAAAQLLTDAASTGPYEIMAELADHRRGYTARGIVIKAMALNRTGLIIGVLGGLGIFIFGMKQMCEGLQMIAGNRLRNVLQFLTKNRFAAVAAGTLVTGMVQSSSACTVMVIGFVNAGLLNLQQSIGVIYGANIGTTITGQMISFKLDGLALPAVAAGVLFIMFSRRTIFKSTGQTIMGFGFLFLGMTMMSDQLKQISNFPSFESFFRTFDCTPGVTGFMPLGAVLGAIAIGTAMTVLVQSSSATIGLTIALAASGLINFYTAVPLILGDNIGTTVTALLASIGTNRRARQAAIAHTLFNVLGTLYMAILFYVPVDGVPVFLHIVNQLTVGDVFSEIPENIARHVAAAHSLFNIVNVIVFLPLVSLVAWLCNFIVPVKDEEVMPVQHLEPHLIDTPSIALRQTAQTLGTMTSVAWNLLNDTYALIWNYKSSAIDELKQREESIDRMQHDVMHYLVLLTQRRLDESQSAMIPLLMHCANDAERIGDHAMNLIDLAAQLTDKKDNMSAKANQELDEFFALIKAQARYVIDSFSSEPDANSDNALKLEGEVNHMLLEIENNHEKRLRKGKCKVEIGILYVELLRELERVADHLSNIAERLPEIMKETTGDQF